MARIRPHSAALVWLASAFIAPAALATLIGDFESDLDGWSGTGSAASVTSYLGVTPTNGSGMLRLTTANGTDDDGTLDSFFGFTTGTIEALSPSGNPVTEGAGVTLTFSGNVGDELSFDFNFLTRETLSDSTTYRDFAFSSIRSNEQGEVVLDDVLSMTRLSTSSTAWSQTGWRSLRYTFATAGTFTVGFGVADVQDTAVSSGLLLDNIRKTPEPSTAAMLGLGLLVMSAKRRAELRRHGA